MDGEAHTTAVAHSMHQDSVNIAKTPSMATQDEKSSRGPGCQETKGAASVSARLKTSAKIPKDPVMKVNTFKHGEGSYTHNDLMADLAVIAKDLKAHDANFQLHEKRHESHEERLDLLEKMIDIQNQLIKSKDDMLVELTKKMQFQGAQIASQHMKISALQRRYSTLASFTKGKSLRSRGVLEATKRKSTKKGGKAWKISKVNSEAYSRSRVFKSHAAKRATSRRFMLFTDFTSTLEIFAPRITTELLEAFEEPEREFRKRNKKKSKANKVRPRALNFEMGDDAPMWTARRTAPTVPTNPITKPNLDKEIPGKLLHMIKDLTFDGKNDSNPIVHLENFVDICDLFKTEETRDDAIHLRVFPLTLTGEAKAWLKSLEPSSTTTWKGLRSKFLSRFFPPSKWTWFSSRATLDSSAGGVFMYKTPTEGYKLLEDMLIHNIDWRTDKRLQIPRLAEKISTDFDPSDELAAMKNQQVKFEHKIEELIKSIHALQVGCKECKEPHLTKDCPNRPMMTPEEVNYLNRGDYQRRWNNNRNFNQRPPSFFAPNQQNQRTEGEPRVSIEDQLIQFMNNQKKINDEVGSYLRNHQSTIQNLEMQVGCISQMLSERTQGDLPTQTQVNAKVDNTKPMLMVAGATSRRTWTDIYTRKYVESDSGSEPDYATDYDSEGFTISFEHLRLKGPIYLSDDEEEDGKQGGYAEFMIPKKNKGKEKKIGIKKLTPTEYQYRGINGYMTTPLGITEGVPIRIGNFVYFTDFIIADLPKDTEIPIILGRAFLHTAQANVDMCNQVSSLGYGDKRIYFNLDEESVTHLKTPYTDPSQAYKENIDRRYYLMSI
ncbi:hypothetical protein OSB04_019445 [Centaurea solstitialis]|uniref:Retrotransposon gag domain-containing protein n=1 Tax=Centaurea solstitialis TaxID=347529 RepID=A0AA38W518_9ASTR|nr:hypothetical protein OSB04_019445 [Centaurea solstitialis]